MVCIIKFFFLRLLLGRVLTGRQAVLQIFEDLGGKKIAKEHYFFRFCNLLSLLKKEKRRRNPLP